MTRFLHSALVPLLCLATVAGADPVDPAVVVAHFGDVPIYAEEMVLHIRDEVALVAVHFTKTYKVHLSKEAWLKDFDGEVPVEMLKQRALDSCREAKAIQVLAVEYGVGERLPFPGLAAHCERLNRSRAAARDAGKILYGSLEYSPHQFYKYKLSNMRNHLRDVVSKGVYEQRESALSTSIAKRMEELPVKVDVRELDPLVAGQVGAE